MGNIKRKTKPKAKRKSRKPPPLKEMVKQCPTVEEAVNVVGNLLTETAELFTHDMEKIEFATAMHSIAVAIAADTAGFELDEELPAKAIGKLIKGIRESATATGRTYDAVVSEMLGRLTKNDISLWN